jgi:hypothetical protein
VSHHVEKLTSGPGWEAFTDPQQYAHAALVLLLATLSGAVLAHHPTQRDKSLTRDDLDRQKTLIVYASVGALIAIICTVAPSMAFVIFGIGGLMRFRTNVGESKSTGHTIMGTLIGLCWGLGLQLVAVLATVYFWLMIFVLEARKVRELTVLDVALGDMGRVSDAYRAAFMKAGCEILGQSKSLKKAKLDFLVRVPKKFSSEDALKAIETIAPELRGTFDWSE